MAEISRLLSDVLGGYRLTESEATRLLKTQDRDCRLIASATNEMREWKRRNLCQKSEPACDEYM